MSAREFDNRVVQAEMEVRAAMNDAGRDAFKGRHPETGRILAFEHGMSEEEVAELKDFFLDALRKVDYRAHACKVVGVPYSAVKRWMESDAEFTEAVLEIEELITERCRAAVIKRAVDGVEEPVFYQGVATDTKTVYSDLLLMFELKRRDPKYRDRAQLEINDSEVKLYQGIDDSKI